MKAVPFQSGCSGDTNTFTTNNPLSNSLGATSSGSLLSAPLDPLPLTTEFDSLFGFPDYSFNVSIPIQSGCNGDTNTVTTDDPLSNLLGATSSGSLLSAPLNSLPLTTEFDSLLGASYYSLNAPIELDTTDDQEARATYDPDSSTAGNAENGLQLMELSLSLRLGLEKTLTSLTSI
jgi:hypothetical protein